MHHCTNDITVQRGISGLTFEMIPGVCKLATTPLTHVSSWLFVIGTVLGTASFLLFLPSMNYWAIFHIRLCHQVVFLDWEGWG